MLELYFDESGNTGTNYLDTRQPFFIYGGWLVERNSKDKICETIREIFYNSSAKELKAKNGYKPEIMKKLFDKMLAFKAIPVFGIADKRYMIAAKITETFFDHMYNPNVNGLLTFRTELKKALADSIFLNEELLNKFSYIIQNGTIGLEAMRKIRDLLSNHFNKEKLFDVQKTIERLSDLNLQSMIEEFEFISKSGKEKRWLTLVQPVLFDRLLNVDIYAEMIGEKVDLFVDELWGYRDVFKEMEGILNKGTIIKNIKFVEQCKSHENILIQAADLLCGFIYATLNSYEITKNNETTNKIWNDFINLSLVFEKENIKIWDYYAHNSFGYRFMYLAGYTGEQREVNCNKIIKRDFLFAMKNY